MGQINKLSAREVETVSAPGRHSDGGGLYLNVTESGGRSWLFMYKVGGRRREMGLGSARDVPLTQARKVAANARQQLAGGLDPLTARQKPAAMTFSEAATALIESMSPAWRNAKHRAQWAMTLKVYCAPIAATSVADVNTDDVLRVLKPLWLAKPETGSRLRGRIERALDFAKARGMRSGENPARVAGPPRRAAPQASEANARASQSHAVRRRARIFQAASQDARHRPRGARIRNPDRCPVR